MKIDLNTLTEAQVELVLSQLSQTPGMSSASSFARQQLQTGAFVDNTSGACLFGPNPSVAPFAFHLVVFPHLKEDQIAQYERIRSVQLPDQYRRVLQRFNGLRAGQMCIYGLFDLSFQKNPDARAAYVPFDVIQERDFKQQQKRPYAELFPIGGTRLSDSENATFALSNDGMVIVFNNAGDVLRSYPSIERALDAEITQELECLL